MVPLTWCQIFIAQWVGEYRNWLQHQRGNPDATGLKTDGVFEHVIGGIGEHAVWLWCGLWWDKSIDRFKGDGADVPPYGLQVRTTHKAHRQLLLRPRDEPQYRYVLATFCDGELVLRGWMWGKDAKQDRYLKKMRNGRPPLYLVPQRDLEPIGTLEKRLVLQ